MREVYLDTENPDREQLKKLEAIWRKGDDDADDQVVKKLADHEIYAKMYEEKDDGFIDAAYQQKGVANIRKLG